jgi:hypothetical protein
VDGFALEVLDAYLEMLKQERKESGKQYHRSGKLFVWSDGRLPRRTPSPRACIQPDRRSRGPAAERTARHAHVYITLCRVMGMNRRILAHRVGPANQTVTRHDLHLQGRGARTVRSRRPSKP